MCGCSVGGVGVMRQVWVRVSTVEKHVCVSSGFQSADHNNSVSSIV